MGTFVVFTLVAILCGFGSCRGTRSLAAVVGAPAGAQSNGARPLPRQRRETYINDISTKPSIDVLKVVSSVRARFAHTVMSSVISNNANSDREAFFEVQIPESAFISNFTMMIGGKLYVGKVKGKEDADQEYQAAKNQSQTAGKVTSEKRDEIAKQRKMEKFSVAVNVAANSSINFDLTYQQLLKRRLGVYEHIISIRPNQIVKKLTANIFVFEPQGIRLLEVKEPSSNSLQNKDAIIRSGNPGSSSEKIIEYAPSMEKQKQMDLKKGLNGDLIIRYDVNHLKNDVGFVQIEDKYFAHFFSPSKMSPLGKDVVFVIDISGSMSGMKIKQTREAMMTILGQLRQNDNFMMILFDNELEYWPAQRTLVSAHAENIYMAKEFAKNHLKADGGTDINMALVTASNMFRGFGGTGASMIVFLTDGEPTAGVTNKKQILANVGDATAGKISIFTLGFGETSHFDYDLLKKLAYRNRGFPKRIYPGKDAGEQLKHFFKEVSTPLLKDVKIIYSGNAVEQEDLTETSFPNYFNGSEIIVCGRLKDIVPPKMLVRVTGKTRVTVNMQKEFDINMSPMPSHPDGVPAGFTEKLWAYMQIKDLLRQKMLTDDTNATKNIDDKALRLSIAYNFVTPLTSMIITQELRKPGSSGIGEIESDVNYKSFNYASKTILKKRPAYGAGGVVYDAGGWHNSATNHRASSIFIILFTSLYNMNLCTFKC